MAVIYANLAMLLMRKRADLKGAEEYCKRALKIKIACYGTENHSDVAKSCTTLGAILRLQGERGKEYCEKALRIQIACYGTEDHADMIESYRQLGWALISEDDDRKVAKKHFQKALDIAVYYYGIENQAYIALCRKEVEDCDRCTIS